MIRCIVIDDEPLAVEKLATFIGKIPEFTLIKTFTSAIEATGFLKDNPIDLVFLDIEMKEMTGIEMLENIQIQSKVIITSAYEKYAIRGFEFQVSDYLLKPFTFSRFLKSCYKVIAELSKNRQPAQSKRIFIKTEYRLEGIEIQSIKYIQGEGDYRKIVTDGAKIMTLQSFKEIQEVLPSSTFVRVHQSFIVNIEKIERIERNRIKIGEIYIPISNSYSIEFYKIIQR